MNKPYFFIQYNGSRGKLAGGIILELSDLLDKSYMKQILRGRHSFMYGYARNSLQDIKSMRLPEFEGMFNRVQIEEIKYLIRDYSVFRREIYDKYSGVEKPNYKKITKLIPGHVYLSEDETTRWLYLGNIHLIGKVENCERVNNSGNCFLHIMGDGKLNDEWFVRNITNLILSTRNEKSFLKGIKKVIKDLGDSGINLDSLSSGKVILPKSYFYSYERVLTYKIERCK